MSKDEQQSGLPESPLDTALTIVSGRRDEAAAGNAGTGAEPPHPTEVTISDPDAGAQRPTEVTIPLAEVRDTAMTVPMEHPPVGSGAAFGELQPGERVERYVIVKRLGKGGMGSVYLARHETLGVFRAIKVLSGELYLRGKEFTKRFIREAKIASSISDPNIVNVLDVGEDPERGFCYIIMEYVDGGTVRDVLKRIPYLSELHAVIIAEAVAVALDAAAEQKIVHRDIKPDNIMLTRRGEVKLADLGIAKNTEENVQLTKSHVMMGTPAYLAPEQAQDAHSVDVRADIYSLGATLFEMLTGRIPYPGKSTYDILRKLVSEPVPDPRSVVNTVSAPTAHLVMRMLAKLPKQRPASAAELLKEIHKLNFLSADIDTKKCIRELLEQSGEGSYSASAYTSATGNAVSSWFVRHVFLRAETMLRKVPFFAALIETVQRNIVLSYVTLGLVLLLLISLPVAWLVTPPGASGAAEPFDAVVVDSPAAYPAAPETPEPPTGGKSAGTEPAGEKPAEPKPAEVRPSETKPAETQAAPAKPAEKQPDEVKAPEAKPAEVQPAQAKTAEAKPAAKVPAAAPVKLPSLASAPPPRVAAIRKIDFSAEVTPAGAEVVLRNDAGRVVETRTAPAGARMKFSVPAGQYKLEVSSPGFRSDTREFPLSESRTISGLKIDLRREIAKCRIEFYGFPKLLAYLRKQGLELSVDDGEWRKYNDFPVELELARTVHTVAIRAKGIQPVRQSWSVDSEQTQSTVEIYLQEKEAVLEIVPEVKGRVRINLFGIWEELRPQVAVPPFRSIVLKWMVDGGEEQTLEIPELPPESVRRIVLKDSRAAASAGAAELAEGKKLIDSGDYAPAAEKLKAAAEQGSAEAIYLLGWMAEEGKGRWFASDKDALAEYRKAAEPPYEYAKAQFKMGDFCENGRGGLERDIKQAVLWYKKAAASKEPEALFRLAMVYRGGEGGEPVDFLKMFELTAAAAELGHLEAQYQLGYCYENGIGVPISVEKAKLWYAKAAERGHANARARGRALESIK